MLSRQDDELVIIYFLRSTRVLRYFPARRLGPSRNEGRKPGPLLGETVWAPLRKASEPCTPERRRDLMQEARVRAMTIAVHTGLSIVYVVHV